MADDRDGGRPAFVFDLGVLANAASIGCTVEEIASVMGCAPSTLYLRVKDTPEIQEAIEAGRAKGRATLRRLQWQGANTGNPTMLIWLGKQLLGQKDKHEVGGPDGGPMVVQIVNFTDETNENHG